LCERLSLLGGFSPLVVVLAQEVFTISTHDLTTDFVEQEQLQVSVLHKDHRRQIFDNRVEEALHATCFILGLFTLSNLCL
jgi:hypothetical protein